MTSLERREQTLPMLEILCMSPCHLCVLADNMIPLVFPSLVHDQQIRSDGYKLTSSFCSEGVQVWSCPRIVNTSPPYAAPASFS